MKVAEYIADFVAGISPRVYGVCGAGAMHLNDAIAKHPKIHVISMQHEQAAAMAAEAEARVTGKMSVVMVTAGPGGTNSMTGVACAYVDSIPMLVIAGQVTTSTMVGHSGTRQIGMNELDMVGMMKPITKYATTVKDPAEILYTLEMARHVATSGRQGPVFVEIPLDVQAAEIEFGNEKFSPPNVGNIINNDDYLKACREKVLDALVQSKRPVIIVGNGVRLSGACADFRRACGDFAIPVVSSWGAADILPTDHPHYIGRCGLFGDRQSNFAVQGADLILAIGTRLSIAQIGHTPDKFAPKAKKIVIDIDKNEVFHKPTVKADIGIVADAKKFLEKFNKRQGWTADQHYAWLRHCQLMKLKYTPHGRKTPDSGISSYGFVEQLSGHIEDNAIVVTDVGFCFIPTMQMLGLRTGQRLIHSAGVSPMGWGIPAAIGAALAGKGQVVCLTGDGGAMFNLQDLQTIHHHKLPVAIFVFENDGYATMKIAQNNHFKREVMSGPRSGMSLPDFVKIAKAFNIVTREYNSLNMLSHDMESIFDIASQVPIIIVMHMDTNELIAPRLQARMENGKFVPVDLSDMWPHLPREEIETNLNFGESDDVKRFDGRRQENVN